MLIAFPVTLSAEIIDVRSGEHVDFSRLVMQFEDIDLWDLSRFDQGYILTTNANDIRYNLKTVFDLIPKKRIEKIEPTPAGALMIYTKPNYHADAFEIRAGRIVIDIKDGTPPKNSTFEKSSSSSPLSPDKTQSSIASQVELLDASSGVKFSTNLSHDIDMLANVLSERADPPFFMAGIDPLTNATTTLSSKERGLTLQLGRAASQGLLEPSTPDTLIPTSSHQISELPFKLHESLAGTGHIHVSNAHSHSKPQHNQNLTFDGNTCINDELLDISMWGSPIEEGLLLPELRANMLGEFDEPQISAVEKLAEYYLFLTFGAEARDVLTEYKVTTVKSELLLALSDIIDFGHSRTPSNLDTQSECGGMAGFWALLAKENLTHQTLYDRQKIMPYFSGLPVHLRRYLGPILAEKLMRIGDNEFAEAIHYAISRVNGDHGDAFALLDAEVKLANGDIDYALESFDSIIQENGTTTPTAAIRAVEIRDANNLLETEKSAELVEILALEHKGTPEENLLKNAAVLARINSGDLGIALQRLLSQKTTNDTKLLLQKTLDQIILTQNDVDFAQSAAFILSQDSLNLISNTHKSEIADRLLKVGFNSLAENYISTDELYTDQQKINFAKIKFTQGDFIGAMDVLAGVDAVEASKIRAFTLMQLNQTHKAALEFATLGDKENFDTISLLEGNWSALSESQTPTLSNLGSLLASPPTDIEDGSLTALNALIEQSRSTRNVFGEILQ